jgi:hypothetical protein
MTQRFLARVEVCLDILVDSDTAEEAQLRARTVACSRPRIRPSEIQRVDVHQVPLAEQVSQDNLRTWQEVEALKIGSSSQRDRWGSGCLPEDELLLLAREELFRPMSLIPRRRRRGPSAIRHIGDMFACMVDGEIPVEWEVLPEPQLDDEQWTTFRRVLTACEAVRRHAWMQHDRPESVRMALREHRGRCKTCERTTSEAGVLVEIDWAQRLLSREYVL